MNAIAPEPMDLVSIIIPVFAVEDYIGQCLESAIMQTYRNIEIICVNDATLDNSIAIISRYLSIDKRIRVVHHDRNRGLSAARNTGLDLCKGSLVKFLDGDDLLEKTAVEELVCAVNRNATDWAFSAFKVVDESGNPIVERSPFHEAYMERNGDSGRIDFHINKADLNAMWPSAWNILWRKKLIEISGARFPEGLLFEDHEFFYRYAFAFGKASYVEAPLYRYRRRPGQITAQSSYRINDVFDVLSRLEPIFTQHLGNQSSFIFRRTCVRLIAERTWGLLDSQVRLEFHESASTFLSRFQYADLLKAKDWYIDEHDLAVLFGKAS